MIWPHRKDAYVYTNEGNVRGTIKQMPITLRDEAARTLEIVCDTVSQARRSAVKGRTSLALQHALFAQALPHTKKKVAELSPYGSAFVSGALNL